MPENLQEPLDQWGEINGYQASSSIKLSRDMQLRPGCIRVLKNVHGTSKNSKNLTIHDLNFLNISKQNGAH